MRGIGRLLLLAVTVVSMNAAIVDVDEPEAPTTKPVATELHRPPTLAPFPDLVGRGGITIVGLDHAPISRGDHRDELAWSTIKVPIAIEGLRDGGSRIDAKAAITRSDNPAAERLWVQTSQAHVHRDLAAYGDTVTRVGSLSWGGTRWTNRQMAGYAANLGCARGPQAREVLALMHRTVPAQQVGLDASALRSRTAQKIGWGPVNGGWGIRQVAVVTLADGRVYGVGISVWDVTEVDARADLDRIARWAAAEIPALDAKTC